MWLKLVDLAFVAALKEKCWRVVGGYRVVTLCQRDEGDVSWDEMEWLYGDVNEFVYCVGDFFIVDLFVGKKGHCADMMFLCYYSH